MSVLLKESQGDTILEAIDGVNTDFTVSFNYNADSVNVYLNGVLLRRDWDNGFWVIPPRLVRLKEAPLDGDSLEIEYKADIKTGGGADGGRPEPPQIEPLLPGVSASQNLPEMVADEVKPGIDGGDIGGPVTLADSLRPVLLKPERGEDPCP